MGAAVLRRLQPPLSSDASMSSLSVTGATLDPAFSSAVTNYAAISLFLKAIPFNFYGWLAVSVDGSTLAVGAWWEDSVATGMNGDGTDNNAVDSGAVYVFTSDSGGVWTQALKTAPLQG